MTKKIIALVGGTGQLGALIADALLDVENVELRLLVRAESRSKVSDLEARGATVVEGALGAGDASALDALVEGAFAVISSIQGGPDLIVEGQAELLRAAREASVRRFIPSTFSLDLFKVPEGQIVTSDWRRRFADLADAERGDVEVVHILNGGFLDRGVLFGFIDVINPETGEAHVWGDGKAVQYWTTYADTAAYAAAAAIDDRTLPRALGVAGAALDFWGLVAAYEAASGKTLAVKTLGTMADLDARIAELASGGQENFQQFLPLMYYRAMLNGDGAVTPLHNDLFPQIHPTDMQAYVRQEGL